MSTIDKNNAGAFPILNVEEGVARFAGNKVVYFKILAKFGALNSTFLSDLEAAVEAGNKETYTRLLHSMKGASGNVSATALFELSRELELGAKTNAPSFDPAKILPRIKPAYEALLAEIARITAT